MDLNEVPQHGFVRHPWERARFDFFHRLLRDHAGLDDAKRILDVGAGDGWFARELLTRLPSHASIACLDPAYAVRGLPPGSSRITFLTAPPDEQFDLLLFLDVLEHIEEDRAFLSTVVRRNAQRGSRALLTVPAWNLLTSSHDRMLQHHRRYSPAQLVDLARQAGLRPILRGELFASLLLPRAAAVVHEKVFGPRTTAPKLHWSHGEKAARAVHAALTIDAELCRAASSAGWRVPGLSTWVLCEFD